MRTVVVPITKNKTGDVSDSSNYIPISLATIVAKEFDSVLNSHIRKTPAIARLSVWFSI